MKKTLKEKLMPNIDWASNQEDLKEANKEGKGQSFWSWLMFSPRAARALLMLSMIIPTMLFAGLSVLFIVLVITGYSRGFFLAFLVALYLFVVNGIKLWENRNINLKDATMWDLLWKKKD